MTTDTDPAPGPDGPVPTWPEYEQLRDAVTVLNIGDTEPPHAPTDRAGSGLFLEEYRAQCRRFR